MEGKELFDTVKFPVAKCISKFTPYSERQVFNLIEQVQSIDLALAAIWHAQLYHISPIEAAFYLARISLGTKKKAEIHADKSNK